MKIFEFSRQNWSETFDEFLIMWVVLKGIKDIAENALKTRFSLEKNSTGNFTVVQNWNDFVKKLNWASAQTPKKGLLVVLCAFKAGCMTASRHISAGKIWLGHFARICNLAKLISSPSSFLRRLCSQCWKNPFKSLILGLGSSKKSFLRRTWS